MGTLPLHEESSDFLSEAEERRLAADMHHSCLVLFCLALLGDELSISLSADQKQLLAKLQQGLFLWGERHDLSSGSLDIILRKSPHLMRLVSGILRLMLKTLIQG